MRSARFSDRMSVSGTEPILSRSVSLSATTSRRSAVCSVARHAIELAGVGDPVAHIGRHHQELLVAGQQLERRRVDVDDAAVDIGHVVDERHAPMQARIVLDRVDQLAERGPPPHSATGGRRTSRNRPRSAAGRRRRPKQVIGRFISWCSLCSSSGARSWRRHRRGGRRRLGRRRCADFGWRISWSSGRYGTAPLPPWLGVDQHLVHVAHDLLPASRDRAAAR